MLPFQMKKWKTEAQVVFFNPFTVLSSHKQKFVIRLFNKEANRNDQFANVLSGLNGLTD
jgi:hypothetical protein